MEALINQASYLEMPLSPLFDHIFGHVLHKLHVIARYSDQFTDNNPSKREAIALHSISERFFFKDGYYHGAFLKQTLETLS